MQVLIADRLSPLTNSLLTSMGCVVRDEPSLTAEELPAAMRDANVLVVRSTRVTHAAIEAAQDLELVIRAGSGYDNIDLESASHRGIYVANCPGRNADAVAELTIGLMIAADRQIASATADLREGRWRKKWYSAAKGLKGRQLGLLGYGAIGQRVARVAQALAMRVVVWSRSLTDEQATAAGVVRAAALEEIAACDAVSIHLPATEATRHLVDAKFLANMLPGAILINTSRGELVDAAALQTAVEEKQLRVGLDVFTDEPAGGDAEFPHVSLARCVTGTPHIGASTEQTAEAIARAVADIVRSFQESGKPVGCVNLLQRSPANWQLVVRHRNQVGVLAGILDGLRAEHINVEEMENRIFAGGAAASCSLRLDAPPSSNLLAVFAAKDDVFQVRCQDA